MGGNCCAMREDLPALQERVRFERHKYSYTKTTPPLPPPPPQKNSLSSRPAPVSPHLSFHFHAPPLLPSPPSLSTFDESSTRSVHPTCACHSALHSSSPHTAPLSMGRGRITCTLSPKMIMDLKIASLRSASFKIGTFAFFSSG